MTESIALTLQSALTADALMHHVEEISKYVRLSGDKDEAKAFDYIEARLKEWGVSYERLTHPGYISLPGKASLTVQDVTGRTINIPCITHSMGATTPASGVSGLIVDLGNGNPEDYTRTRFGPGDVALMSGLAAPAKVVLAAEHGAGAAVFVNGSELHEMIVSPVWGSPSSESISLLPNLPVVSILGEHGAQIRECLKAAATPENAEGEGPAAAAEKVSPCEVTATIHTEVLTEWREIPQLIAEIEGHVYPDELVLFGGHVDSWHYGAMDNASANAVQLEALRIFQENKDSLVRTLRVAFWSGHSHGRYAGSQWYADTHFAELERRAVLHMYVDSVGGQGATVLSEAWAMSETKHVAANALKLETGETFHGGRFARGGDQSFYGVGVSGLFMCLSEQPPEEPTQDGSERVSVSAILGGNGKTGGLGSWWHATDDTADKLDPEFLLRDARVYFFALSQYLQEKRLELDFRPTVVELRDHLATWQTAAGEYFSLQQAMEACGQLADAVDALYEANLNDEAFNRAVVGLSRHLVPLNYSYGDRFTHDAALTLPPIPALSPITDLADAAAKGKDALLHLTVLIRRRANFVTQTLIEATRLVELFLC